MTRLFSGTIHGHPCVKVTRSNADAPWEVPNADYGRFAFNSDHEHAYVQHIRTASFNDYAYEGSEKFYNLDGSPSTNQLFRVFTGRPSLSTVDAKRLQILLDNSGLGFMPLAELRLRQADGQFRGPTYTWTETWIGQLGIYQSRNAYSANGLPETNPAKQGGYTGRMVQVLNMQNAGEMVVGAVWDLPADSTPLQANGTVVPGQMQSRFTNLHAQVARPGFDVRTATGRQFILNSDRVPAKLIQSGETAVPAGGTETIPITSPFPLTEEMYVDFLLANVGEQMCNPAMSFYSSFGAREFGFNYRLLSGPNRLVLYNTKNRAIVVRWMLLADNSAGQTTGGSRVVYSTPDFVQIKRPGSSDVAPSMKDVLLDTRLPTLRIVAEGYLPHATFTDAPTAIGYGEKAKLVSFSNPGGRFRPFVKFVGIDGDGNMLEPLMVNFRVNSAEIDGSHWHGRANAYSLCAVVNDTSVRFHHSRDNPSTLRVTPSAPRPYADPQYPAQESMKLAGIRYYIFALPN